jgi:hypothetical protein
MNPFTSWNSENDVAKACQESMTSDRMGKRKTTLQKMKNSFFGYVIGTAMQKTIKVRVERIKMHPIVKKVSQFNSASQNAQELLGT